MPKTMLYRVFILVIALFSMMMVVTAQGGDLPPNTLVADNYSGTPIIYTFAGSADDVVTLYVVGNGGLSPTLAIASSSGQPIAFGNSDPLTPITSDTRLTVRLPQTDTYIVTLSSLNASTGAFSLLRTVSPPVVATPITQTLDVTILPNTAEQVFSLAANPSASQQVTLTSAVPNFTAQVRTNDGIILAVIAGGVESITLTIPASSTDTIVTIGAVDADAGAIVQVSLGGSTGSTSTPATTSTDPNQCVAVGNSVNLRSGPGTNYPAVASLTSDGQVVVTGQNNGWYYGSYNGQLVWVAASVVTVTGNCASIPFVEAPPAPVAPPPQVTEEVTGTTQEQPTSAPSPTATSSDSSSNTSTQAPTPTTAPTDVPFTVVSLSCNYALNDGATVFFNVTGQPNSTFAVETRFGSTTYSVSRTMNNQGFLNANQRFGQVGNSNYDAYIVYNGQDVASTEC